MSGTLPPIHVVAIGASTPIGRDAWSSAAAVRGEIAGFIQHPYMVDTAGEPMRVAMAPWLDIDCEGSQRLTALLVSALDQAIQPLASVDGVKVALALGSPLARPGIADNTERELRDVVQRTFPKRFEALAVFPAGHASTVLGMGAACQRLSQGTYDACVVAGVDSYLAAETLEWLEANDQLHGAGRMNNAWGFVPGEAAGACLLVTAPLYERLNVPSLGRVLSIGTSVEPNRIKTQTVCLGEGLTAAMRAGLSGLPADAKVTDMFCDMNGEPYRADEFGFACLRTRDAFVSASNFVAPADCWGDVGAASATLSLMLSVAASAKGYANGPYALLWASSESGERGAALMTFDTALG